MVSQQIFYFSVSAGLIALDYLDNNSAADIDKQNIIETLLDDVNSGHKQDCHEIYPCIPFLNVYKTWSKFV